MSSKWKAGVVPTKFILVTSRRLARAEKVTLGKTYKNFVEYSAELHGILDISKAPFDLLIINGYPLENHRFLEMIKQKLPDLNILPIVLKYSGSRCEQFAEDLGAVLISHVEDLAGADLLAYFTKSKLTKLKPRWKTFLLACFRVASSS